MHSLVNLLITIKYTLKNSLLILLINFLIKRNLFTLTIIILTFFANNKVANQDLVWNSIPFLKKVSKASFLKDQALLPVKYKINSSTLINGSIKRKILKEVERILKDQEQTIFKLLKIILRLIKRLLVKRVKLKVIN